MDVINPFLVMVVMFLLSLFAGFNGTSLSSLFVPDSSRALV
jgi:hypothetical protein